VRRKDKAAPREIQMKTSENKSDTTQRLRGEGSKAKEKVKEKKM